MTEVRNWRPRPDVARGFQRARSPALRAPHCVESSCTREDDSTGRMVSETIHESPSINTRGTCGARSALASVAQVPQPTCPSLLAPAFLLQPAERTLDIASLMLALAVYRRQPSCWRGGKRAYLTLARRTLTREAFLASPRDAPEEKCACEAGLISRGAHERLREPARVQLDQRAADAERCAESEPLARRAASLKRRGLCWLRR